MMSAERTTTLIATGSPLDDSAADASEEVTKEVRHPDPEVCAEDECKQGKRSVDVEQQLQQQQDHHHHRQQQRFTEVEEQLQQTQTQVVSNTDDETQNLVTTNDDRLKSGDVAELVPSDAARHGPKRLSDEKHQPELCTNREALCAAPRLNEEEEIKQEHEAEQHYGLTFQRQDESMRPGAVAVYGMPYGNITPMRRVAVPQEAQQQVDDHASAAFATVEAQVVAEVVDGEQQLVSEILSFVRRNVVPAEHVAEAFLQQQAEVEGEPINTASDSGIKNNSTERNTIQVNKYRRLWMSCGCVLAVVVAVVVVLVAFFVARRPKSSAPLVILPSATAKPLTQHPSPAPTVSRFEMFRALLLNQSVMSADVLNNESSPQYQSLSWLANHDKAKLSVTNAPLETIVNRYVVAMLYHATNGKHWTSQHEFLSSKSICEWHLTNDSGVFCNPLRLYLGDNGLIGTIPTELGRLTTITDLFLDVNSLFGTIPTELGGLTMLMNLVLGINALGGTIPTELGRLTMLTNLVLGGNALLVGAIPSELGRLTMLTDLSLSYVALNGTIPTELGLLTMLSKLFLWNNTLSKTIPTNLGRLTKLTHLDLGGNTLSGTIPTELGRLKMLSNLNLNRNTLLAGTIPPELGEITMLTYLSLSFNSLRGTIPVELGSLTMLTTLSLSNNALGGTIPVELGRLTILHNLILWNNSFSGTVPSVLATSPLHLESLFLQYNNITGNLSKYFCSSSEVSSWSDFQADCISEVICSCCTQCY